MGTHDLSKIKGPITYEALPPSKIIFQALKQTKKMDANALFKIYKDDIKMKKFIPILEKFDKYPVFYDKNRQVLSLPPIINSEATKITLNTKDVFIEITGTDLMKAKTCLAILAAQFSEHCGSGMKHKVEQVEIIYEGNDSQNEITPQMNCEEFNVELEYINRILGVELDVAKVKESAEKMGLVLKNNQGQKLKFIVPPTRSDILHACDIIEDVGIGYGFNNIPKEFPENNTVG